jgi:hypothetical protein
MLPRDLPSCVCGRRDWEPRGGSYGGNITSSFFKCKCGRSAWVLSGYGCGSLALIYEAAEDVEEWVNHQLLAQWRFVSKTHKATHRPALPPPPALPSGTVAFLVCGTDGHQEWGEMYTPANTRGNVAPEDPIAVDHREYWSQLLAELGITQYRTVSNRYDGSALKPWYEFVYADARWVVGPRHRVDVLEVVTLIDLEPIQKLAKADDVTHYGNGSESEPFGIHAWTREKFVEYFNTLAKETL